MKVVDLFAGAGGFSTGARNAGASVLWAGNHWKEAVEIHSMNHSETIHVCQDLHQADWEQVPSHDLLVASPCCQGHSRAKGKPRKGIDKSRSTAWAVTSACEFHRPKFFVVENVVEFLTWELFPSWLDAMKRLGYQITVNKLNAAEFGVPQSRERLFLVGSLGKPVSIESPKLDPIPALQVIDWEYPDWSPVTHTRIGKPRSQAIVDQVLAGRKRFGNRFMVAYYGNEKAGRSIEEPIGTITTRDRFAVVDGDRMRFLNRYEVREAMGFPRSYVMPETHRLSIHLLGNAVCPPVAEEIVNQIQEVA